MDHYWSIQVPSGTSCITPPPNLPTYTIYAIVVPSHDIPRKEPHNVLPARIP